MFQSNIYRIAIRSFTIIVFCIMLLLLLKTSIVAEENTVKMRWDKQRILDYPIYRLLLKARSVGSGTPEFMQWEFAKDENKPFVDTQRENNLRALLSSFPDSEYADDAALLLARARFFYHDDAVGAIEDLYKVISKYPKGTWIAEDILFLDHAMLKDMKYGWYGPERSLQDIEKIPETARKSEMGTWTAEQEELNYFEHWEKYPNLTRDEARFWIGKIIVLAGIKDRYNEAASNFRQVIDAHKKDKREEIDYAESKKQYGSLIWSKFPRTERECHRELINLYIKTGKFQEARQSAEDFLSLYINHPSCKFIQSQLETVKKELSK